MKNKYNIYITNEGGDGHPMLIQQVDRVDEIHDIRLTHFNPDCVISFEQNTMCDLDDECDCEFCDND